MESSKSQYYLKKKQRIEEARIVRKIVFIIFLAFLIIFLSVGSWGFFYIKSALEPIDPASDEQISVTIPIGSSVRAIAELLEDHNIIKDDKVFRYYIKFRNEQGFQAGDYELSPSMTFQEIIDTLKTGKVIQEALFSITIPEGKNLEEIVEILSNRTEHSKEDILTKLNDKKYISLLMERYPTILTEEILQEGIRYPLEGYLFPATYDFYEESPSIESIVEMMLDQTKLILSQYEGQMHEKEMTVHELLTMASLIEEEATKQSDREEISGVFYNRLNIGMPLQTDPTVLYALGRHQVRITYDDLKVNSPYNTYVVNGLPIGPIANAGETSIQAALNPAETENYYFFARPNGEVIFTASLDEHNKIVNQYRHEWDPYKE